MSLQVVLFRPTLPNCEVAESAFACATTDDARTGPVPYGKCFSRCSIVKKRVS